MGKVLTPYPQTAKTGVSEHRQNIGVFSFIFSIYISIDSAWYKTQDLNWKVHNDLHKNVFLHFRTFPILFAITKKKTTLVAYRGGLSAKMQPVSYKRYFRCYNCFLLLVNTINLSKYKFGKPATDGNLFYETCVS